LLLELFNNRFTAIAASLIVIATAGTLLLGALERFFR
jgi:hypothetical protein